MKLVSFGILLPPRCALSTTPEGAAVRVTSNPDVAKGRQFLGNVKATSGWGGPAGTGLGTSNTEKTLQNKTVKLVATWSLSRPPVCMQSARRTSALPRSSQP